MSLLLDALKKAAEQKAEKSRQEAQVPDSSDETVITSVADDATMFEAGADSTAQTVPRGVDDQTHIDATEMQTRVETTHIESEEFDATEMQTRVETTHIESEEFDATEMQTRVETTQFDNEEVDATEMQTRVDSEQIDDTDLEYTGSTQTQSSAPAEQMQSEEDETIILDNEDVTEFLGEPELVKRDPEDETELTQPAPNDTDLDDTDLNEVSLQGNTVGPAGIRADEDDTDISRPFEAGGQAEPLSDGQTEIDATETDDDEDMSLLLVDHDDTNLTAHKEITGQPVTSDNTPQTEFEVADTEGLALVDQTQHQPPQDATEISVPTRSSATVTTGTATQTQGLASPMETTSTRTYAPDNYDRTLMKLPSDDASKIFAGMKSSDNDVVMTPDYAKKVFRSKSSAQRMQVYKVYTGIALVILLSIAVFGTFEFQQQSSDIETSLRPLKRDPMPGIIQPDKPAADSNVFGETGVDPRTLEMIESADNRELAEVVEAEEVVEMEQEVVETEEPVVANDGVIAGQAITTEEVEGVESVVEDDSATAQTDSIDSAQGEAVDATQVADNSPQQIAADEPDADKSSLKIISSSQIEQKDLWLREAYAAYKAGDENLARTRYNQVLEVDPTNRNALLARAAINVQSSNSDAAIRDYRTLLLQNPKDSLAMTSLIAVANLSPLETESQLKLMIRDEPDSPYLNFALANAYGAQQRWQEAQGYYFKALENNPGDPNYAYNLAVSLEHISQPQAAIVYYQRALANIGNSLATFNRDIVSQRVEMLAKK